MEEIKNEPYHTWIDPKGRVMEYSPAIQKMFNSAYVLMKSEIISEKEYYILRNRIIAKTHKNDPM